MPSNPIGKNTTNLSVNVSLAERKLLGRIAGPRRPVAALVRSLVLRGLLVERPADAALLIRIREGRR